MKKRRKRKEVGEKEVEDKAEEEDEGKVETWEYEEQAG